MGPAVGLSKVVEGRPHEAARHVGQPQRPLRLLGLAVGIELRVEHEARVVGDVVRLAALRLAARACVCVGWVGGWVNERLVGVRGLHTRIHKKN